MLWEPVGCLVEFPCAPFQELSVRLFGRKGKSVSSASLSYWRLLNLIDAAKKSFGLEKKNLWETLVVEAKDAASLYEDILPALAELKSIGIRIVVASSLSGRVESRFIERNSLGACLSGVRTPDDVGGVKAAPLVKALGAASLASE